MLLADGFEDAYIGVVYIFNKVLSVYDMDLCLDILVKRDGMTREEAQEYFDFNVLGAYVGEDTPAFFESISLDDTIERIQEA